MQRFPTDTSARLALVKGALWTRGMDVRIHFMSGDEALHRRIADAAQEWTRHANIHFIFGAGPDADVRVAFTPDGSWSHIGTDARRLPQGKPTMNFGWLHANSTEVELRRVVLHEFGHMLGCIHEHQNPAGGIPWKRQAVYDYYTKPPNNWDKAKVDQNLFAIYDKDLTAHTTVDRDSIMMYPIPSAFTTNGYSVALNTDLSATDKAFIKKMYPE